MRINVALALLLAIWLLLIGARALAQDVTPELIYRAVELRGGDAEHPCGEACERGGGDPTDALTWDEAIELAALFNSTAARFELDPLVFVAVGLHESNLQQYAVGRGGECGMFQQTPRYVLPEDLRELPTDEICGLLFDPAFAVEALALQIVRWRAREGDLWPCHYNRGYECDGRGLRYAERHYTLLRALRRRLEAA